MARNTNIYSSHWIGSAGWGTSKMLGGQTITSQKSLGPTGAPTLIQIGQRMSMATLVAAGRQIKAALDPGFNERRVKNKPSKCRNTSWGAYTGENRKRENNVFDYTIPNDPVFDPTAFIAARGTITPTTMTTATGDISDQEISLTWPDTALDPGQQVTDKLWIVLYDETSDLWSNGILLNVVRSVGSIVNVPLTGGAYEFDFTLVTGHVVRAYTFFQGFDDIGSGTPAPSSNGKESDSTSMVVTLSA